MQDTLRPYRRPFDVETLANTRQNFVLSVLPSSGLDISSDCHVFPDLDVRMEVSGADEPGGDVLTRLPRS